MNANISIAVETSCRTGGVAMGRGAELLKAVRFDASCRHATQLVQRLDELLRGEGLGPRDLAELYVSVGPGSFTGLRVGVTVARTLAQTLGSLRVVAVPTIQAVAENARDLPWRHLGVVMDYKDGEVYAMIVARATSCIPADARRGTPHETGPALFGPALIRPEDLLARAPRPLLLIGEALEFAKTQNGQNGDCTPASSPGDCPHSPTEKGDSPRRTAAGTVPFFLPADPGVALADPALWLPTPEGVWRVGRRLAEAGAFIDYHKLLPLYTRKPEAVRLWEKLGRA